MLLQLDAGQKLVKRKKQYIEIDRRINTLQTRFDQGEIEVIEYLQGISYNMVNPVTF